MDPVSTSTGPIDGRGARRNRTGRRRGWVWWLVALLFVGVPLLEIYLLVQLGQVVGAWWTIAILLADGILGSYLVKREGSRTWRALQTALTSGRMPAAELADGALVLVGGTLLLTPGFVTDVVGLFCILPFTRPVARRVLTRVIGRRLVVSAGVFPPAGARVPPWGRPGAPPPRGGGVPPGRGDAGRGDSGRGDAGRGDVVPGEVVEDR